MRTSRRDLHAWPGTLRPVWVAAAYADRPERTIRTWARTLQVTSACHATTRELLVDLADITRVNAAAGRRNRAAA